MGFNINDSTDSDSLDKWQNVKKLLHLAGPITAAVVLQQATLVSNVIFLGHIPLDEDSPYSLATYMAGATLGRMMCNITGFSLAFGMTSALDTLLSQAYGAKKYSLVGLHTQRSIIILSILSFLVAWMWTKTEFVLVNLLQIDDSIARLSGQWAYVSLIGLWPTVMYAVATKFVQNQQIVWPVTVCNALGTLVNIVSNYILVMRLRWGFIGCAYTLVIQQWVMFVGIVTIILLRRRFVAYLRANAGIDGDVAVYQSVAGEEAVGMGMDLGGREDQMGSPAGVEMVVVQSPLSRGQEAETDADAEVETEQVGVGSECAGVRDSSYASVSGLVSVDMDMSMGTDCGVDVDVEAGGGLGPAVVLEGLDIDMDDEDDPEDNWPRISFFPTPQSLGGDLASDCGSGGGGESVHEIPVGVLFEHWDVFFSLGCPAAVSLFIEWGSYELSAGIAGQLPNSALSLAVHSIFSSIAGLTYQVPQAVAFSTAILTGQQLGAGRPVHAQLFVSLGVAVDCCYGLSLGLCILLSSAVRRGVSEAFTADPEVRSLTYFCLPVMALYIFVDATKCITVNCLRSIGRPKLTVIGNSIACIGVLLPVGYYCSVVRGGGIVALWASMSVAWMVATAMYCYILCTTDWGVEAAAAADRNKRSMDSKRSSQSLSELSDIAT